MIIYRLINAFKLVFNYCSQYIYHVFRLSIGYEEEGSGSSEDSNFIDDDSIESGSEEEIGKDPCVDKKRRRISSELSSSSSSSSSSDEEIFNKKYPKAANASGGPQKCINCVKPADDLFKCKKSTVHLKCTNCEIPFPERPEYSQTCFCCYRSFCNMY